MDRLGNETADERLIGEANAFARCAASRVSDRARLTPKAWNECVGVACGFHACVVGQSIYEPQIRVWLNAFSSPQVS